jgi:hypothetical protein
MTARIWTGTVRRADADAYAALYPEDERYLVGGRSTVTHYEVVDRSSRSTDEFARPASSYGQQAKQHERTMR